MNATTNAMVWDWRNAPKPAKVSGPAETLAVEEPIKVRVDTADDFGRWLLGYNGPSTFLRSLSEQANRRGWLTINQFDKADDAFEAAFEAVQNDYAAIVARAAVKVDAIAAAKNYAPVAEVAEPAPAATIPNGYYTVAFPDGSHVTFRVKDGFAPEHKAAGTKVIGYLAGPDNSSDYVGFGFLNAGKLAVWSKFRGKLARQEAAYKVLIENAAGAGEAYALKSSHCFRCNRLLTVPASLHRGLGPECAGKVSF